MFFALLLSAALSRRHRRHNGDSPVLTELDSGVSEDVQLTDRVRELREMLDQRELSKRIRNEVKSYLGTIGLTNDLLAKAASLKTIPDEMGRLVKNYRTVKARVARRSAAARKRQRQSAK